MTNYKIYAINCEACGEELINTQLKTVQLARFGYSIRICNSCLEKTSEQSFKDAVDIVKEIVSIANSGPNRMEDRLEMIRLLLKE